MNPLMNEVVRQALVEYLAARHCFENTPEHIAEGLAKYVAVRYASHDQSFRDYKLKVLGPRIVAAFEALKELAS